LASCWPHHLFWLQSSPKLFANKEKYAPEIALEIYGEEFKVKLFWIFIFAFSTKAAASSVNVAVAANFIETAQELAPIFKKQTGHELILTSGATGRFYAQIKSGAPFEVLLSADRETPQKLVVENWADKQSEFTYAIGRLVLWSEKKDYIKDGDEILKNGTFDHLAIANPQLAPYGQAAQQTLTRLKLWDLLSPRIVRGESIGQAFQFVKTGHAELGFVAYSQIKNLQPPGSFWIVPPAYYEPLVQDAVLLKKGAGHKPAQQFLDFLKNSNEARITLEKYGYLHP
jgi:molybdate transport system substrate-binding protein